MREAAPVRSVLVAALRLWLLGLGLVLALAGSAQAQSGSSITVPALTWTRVAEVSRATLGRSTYLPTDPTPGDQSLSGTGTIAVENNTAARQLKQSEGLQAGQVARSAELLPANVPLVLARYAPLSAVLVVDLYKVERYGARTGVYHASFTPAHGAYWAAARTYLDASSKALGISTTYGPNPFAAFDAVGGGSTTFQGISLAGAEVAIGHAMRLAGAPIGILIVANAQVTYAVSQPDVLYAPTVQATAAELDPVWYIAAPATNLPLGATASICAINTTVCPQGQVAYAQAVFDQWQGGSLPTTPNPLIGTGLIQATPITVSSGATTSTPAAFLAFAQAIGASSAFVTTYGPTVAGQPSQAIQAVVNLMAPTLNGNSQTLAGFSATGTLPVAPPAGSITNGQVGAVSGTSDPVEATLLQGEATYVTSPTLDSSNLMTAAQTLYYGNATGCPASSTIASCVSAGAPTGVVPRTDSYVETNLPNVYQDTKP